MKIRGFIILIPVISTLFFGCGAPEGSLRALLALESWKGQIPGPEQVAMMEKELAVVQGDVDQIVAKTQYRGTLLKAAALQFLENRMYGPAQEYLLQALAIQPESPSLNYYAGLTESNLAKIMVEPETVVKRMERAATYHKRALELDEGFIEAYFALAVIYGLELARPEVGLEWIDRYIDRQKGVVRGESSSGRSYRPHRLKASLLMALDRRSEALKVYREILRDSRDPEDLTLAEDRIRELEN